MVGRGEGRVDLQSVKYSAVRRTIRSHFSIIGNEGSRLRLEANPRAEFLDSVPRVGYVGQRIPGHGKELNDNEQEYKSPFSCLEREEQCKNNGGPHDKRCNDPCAVKHFLTLVHRTHEEHCGKD